VITKLTLSKAIVTNKQAEIQLQEWEVKIHHQLLKT